MLKDGAPIINKNDVIKHTHIDYGLGASQVNAGYLPISDAGGYYTGTDVETALQEIGAGTAIPNIFVKKDGTEDLTGNWTIATNSITLTAGTLTANSLTDGITTVTGGDIEVGNISARHYLTVNSSEWPEVRFTTPTDDEVMRIGVASSDSAYYSVLAGDMYFYNSSINRMDLQIKKAGGVLLCPDLEYNRVFIGSDSIGYTNAVNIARSANTAVRLLFANPNTGNAARAGLILVSDGGTDNAMLFEIFSSNFSDATVAGHGMLTSNGTAQLLFGTAGTKRMAIDTSGNITMTNALTVTGLVTCSGNAEVNGQYLTLDSNSNVHPVFVMDAVSTSYDDFIAFQAVSSTKARIWCDTSALALKFDTNNSVNALTIDSNQNSTFVGYVSAGAGFKDNGVAGIDTTFLDQNGNTITVSGGIITAKTAP